MIFWSNLCRRRRLLALCASLLALLAPVLVHAASGTFDHATTGFDLRGMHRDVPCEGCHAGGIFKGTPHECVACHAPGTRIGATAKPATHITSGSDCAQCHTPFGWRPVARFNHLNVFGTCSTCHNNVQAAGKPTSHPPTTAECNSCHSVTGPWSQLQFPSNHIPTSTTSLCTDCHTGNSFAVVPSLTNIHRYAPSSTGNCAQCHGSAAPSFAIPAIGFSVVGMPSSHVPVGSNGACENCHVGANSSIAALPVVDGAKFSGSAMSHAGISTCVTCHGPSVTGASFYGITKIIVMPPTSPQGPAAHIPSSTACESCHLGSMPAGLVSGNASASIPGTLFATPVPTTAQIHAGIAANCASCHERADQWVDVVARYPINPAVISATTLQYFGFQTRPGPAGSATNLVDAAHPASGDCSQCHTRTDYFEGQLKPANHIPTASGSACTNCHKGADFSVIPALVDIHANAPSTTANCAQCHGPTTAPTFAIPSANFSIVTTPANHLPTTAPCESCHVGANSSIAATPVPNGAKFSNSAMNHAGLTTCVGCHGPSVTGTSFFGISAIIAMPPSAPMGPSAHIPSATACEGCHLPSMPVGLIPANATKTIPGTAFETPAPTTALIHAGITANCASCHEGGDQWLDALAQYPLSPATLTAGTVQYFGFQTRPGKVASTTNVLDGAHPTSGDCSQCHTRTDYFEGQLKPANHIPTAAGATCGNCHKVADFSVQPALVDIHTYAPSTTTNCTQCHGPTTAPTFAIPSANFSIVTSPANHIPTTASCEACHVGAGSSVATTPVPNGAKFANSAMGHAGVTTCVGCHGPTVTGASFIGITRIVVMPPTTPVGASSHIPSATSCETCHLPSVPAGLVAANATASPPGTLFATPAPTTTMIHTGIVSGCTNCHEAGDVWLDISKYPISPSTIVSGAQYTGFQTRPTATGGTYSVADSAHPASGDCVGCHGGNFNYFSAQAEPANHIPTLPSATCSTCHTTAGNFAVYTSDLTALHGQVPTTCSTCHADGKGPFAGAPGFAIVQMSTRGRHIPITNAGVAAECSGCHLSVTSFAGTIMSHMVIGDSATSATGNACDACHEFGFQNEFFGVSINFTRLSANHHICGAPGTPTAPNVTICTTGGGSDCLTGCHQHNFIPATYKSRPTPPRAVAPSAATPAAATPATGGRVAGAKPDHATLGSQACQTCHNGRTATGKAPSHPATSAACADCHATIAWQPALRVDHADVLGKCATCHDGTRAVAKPAGHPLASGDCDRCHSTSGWTPAAFDHAGAGACASCHDGTQAAGRPPGHVATIAKCDTCHYVLAWKPVKPAPKPRPPSTKTPARPPTVARPGVVPPAQLP